MLFHDLAIKSRYFFCVKVAKKHANNFSTLICISIWNEKVPSIVFENILEIHFIWNETLSIGYDEQYVIIKQLRQEGKITSFKVALYGFYSKSTRRTKKYFYCHWIIKKCIVERYGILWANVCDSFQT